MALNLNWTRYTNGNYIDFTSFNLAEAKVSGVYVIWHGAPNPWTVRVGKGNVNERLGEHRQDPAILYYKNNGGLWVTWAAVDRQYLEGVEAYLGAFLKPKVGTRFPEVQQIVVNSPWG